MAGVGLELQKLVRKGTLFSTIKAFMYGSVLAAGPIILTIITVGVIGWMSYGLFQSEGLRLFTVTVVYTFAFSLILSGPTQIVFTRFVADKHFSREFDLIYPAFLTSVITVLILALLAAVPFYVFLKIYVPIGNIIVYKISGTLTFLAVCLIWQIMGFISTTKEYQKIVLTYLGGTIISIILAYVFIPNISVAGAVAGFCFGQWFIAIVLFYITTKDLNKEQKWRKEYFSYFIRYPAIALTGLLYNIGLWIDKFVFWGHFKQQQGASLFYTYNFYDVPNFLAFLTIIPALAYFLILTETNFFKDYRAFVNDVLSQPFLVIENKKQDMIATLKEGMTGMIKLQGIITLLLIVFAKPIIFVLGYSGLSIWLLRIMLIGVFFHVINLHIQIIFLYYELRKKALFLTAFYAALNGIFTLISIKLGTPFFGFGFLSAALLTTCLGWPLLMRSVQKIDFLIFASQPIDAVVQKERTGVWQKVRPLLGVLSNRFTEREKIHSEYYN